MDSVWNTVINVDSLRCSSHPPFQLPVCLHEFFFSANFPPFIFFHRREKRSKMRSVKEGRREESRKGRIPNDSFYPRPDCYSNAPESTGFTELGKCSGWAMIEGRGGKEELQKIVLVKYDDLHLSRYKEILWPSSRGFFSFPSPSGLNYFLTHDQRSIRSRVRIFRRDDFFFELY